MPERRFLPGLLTEELGWVWRRVGGMGGPETLHLIPSNRHRKDTTACGRSAQGPRLPTPNATRYCGVCTERNGGVAP